VRRQRGFAERGQALRARLLEALDDARSVARAAERAAMPGR